MTIGRNFVFPLILICSLALATGTRAADGLGVLPPEVTLSTPESRQTLIVQETAHGEIKGQRATAIEWSSSDPKIATIANGVVTPVRDGRAIITAKAGTRTATATVDVKGMNRPFTLNFRDHVEPILAKQGCNSGACHGALAGKGGFKLSLQGYDPAADYFNIVKQDRGRRIELAEPGRSLLLAKPSGAIAHKGGVRFGTDSLEYRMLAGWISAGANPPGDADARVLEIDVLPARSAHKVGESQQILVRAR